MTPEGLVEVRCNHGDIVALLVPRPNGDVEVWVGVGRDRTHDTRTVITLNDGRHCIIQDENLAFILQRHPGDPRNTRPADLRLRCRAVARDRCDFPIPWDSLGDLVLAAIAS